LKIETVLLWLAEPTMYDIPSAILKAPCRPGNEVHSSVHGQCSRNQRVSLPQSVIRHFGARPFPKPDKQMDAVIISVAHSQFRKMGVADICRFMNSHPV
jgi:hypothetical protein